MPRPAPARAGPAFPDGGGPALPVTSGQGYPSQNGYPGQAGAYPGYGTGTQQRRPVGAWAIIGAVVLGLVVGVFALVNLSLIFLKRRTPEAAFRVPMVVPVFGALASFAALAAAFGGLT